MDWVIDIPGNIKEISKIPDIIYSLSQDFATNFKEFLLNANIKGFATTKIIVLPRENLKKKSHNLI